MARGNGKNKVVKEERSKKQQKDKGQKKDRNERQFSSSPHSPAAGPRSSAMKTANSYKRFRPKFPAHLTGQIIFAPRGS